MKVGTFRGYEIFLSDRPDKKYYAIVNNKKVYFGGDPRIYQHYEDKMKYYRHLDHHDKERRKRFKARHYKRLNEIGTPTWFSDQILW